MRRLNVQFSQIEECIRTSLFAVEGLPANPPLVEGEELLLQLVVADARPMGKEHQRIEFALIFKEARSDPTGSISREHWPNAGKTWPWILVCSKTIPTIPFSLEDLQLSRSYSGQTNAQYIDPADEQIVRPYLRGGDAIESLSRPAGVDDMLTAIRNYDRVFRLAPLRDSKVAEHTRRMSDPWLGDALKTLYKHRCQICLHDFKPRYGVPYADTRFLCPLDRGGSPVSFNTVVVCPNHDAIIGAAHADFDRPLMAFRYPNGPVEELTLRDHLLLALQS